MTGPDMTQDTASLSSMGADPYARTQQVFPRLGAEMLQRIRAYGVEQDFAPGDMLYRQGDRRADFFVITEGTVDVLEPGTDAEPQIVTTHQCGQFTGELDQVSDRALLVSGRVASPSRIIRVLHKDLPRLLSSEPDIGELVMRAFMLRRMGFLHHSRAGIILIGSQDDGDVQRLARFVIRNGYPLRLVEPGAEADALLLSFALRPDQLPVVIAPDRTVLCNPDIQALADHLGLTERFDPEAIWDVVVVGAGPAGLAASVYAASEGLSTALIESLAPGGQAGTSSRIENYLGFPTGISGQALAGRAQVQAQRFGARLAVSRMVTRLDCETQPFRLTLEDGQTVQARAVVIATGAHYQKLRVPDYGSYEGCGLYYAATAMEARICRGRDVVVVGGGNSAGQAAMYLSRHVNHVHMLVRGAGLSATMSDYLVQRILSSNRISLHSHCEVTALEGDPHLAGITWTDRRDGSTTRVEAGALFVMIGALPNTDWLRGCLDLDERGFVITGLNPDSPGASPYETARPGIYAVGDVRAGSVKRVASGVGEGSVVVQAVHGYLSSLNR